MEGRWSRLGTDAMMDGARPAGGPDHRPVTKGNHCFLVNIFAHRDRPPRLTGVESLSPGLASNLTLRHHDTHLH